MHQQPAPGQNTQRIRLLITTVFVLLALVYMVSSPIFEVSDEGSHFPVIEYIAQTGELPYQDPTIETRWKQEGSQPPLYYMLVALPVSLLELDDYEARHFYNPHAKIGIGLATDNQNMYMHDGDAESFPWQDTTLAVMIGRLFSITLGAGTIWLVFSLARWTFPQHPSIALLAMVLTAFNPMFVYITASVNNDNLVIFLGTAILTLALYHYRTGWSWSTIGGLGVLCGLAALTKLSGLTFAPLISLMIFIVYLRERRPLKDLIVAALIIAGSIALIAGWWYIRNIDLYGDVTGLNRMVDIAGHRPDNFGLDDLWEERNSFYYAYWGWFGGVNIISPQFFYELAGIVYLVGLGGLIWRGITKFNQKKLFDIKSLSPALFLIFQILIVFGGVVRWSLQTPASQGRLVFPVIAAINILIATGIVYVFQQRLSALKIYSAFLIMPLAFYALALPFLAIQPAYTPPEAIEALPENIQFVDVQYDGIQLSGYRIQNAPVHWPEEPYIELTLYWQPLFQTETPRSLFVQVYQPDRDGVLDESGLIGKLDSFPGGGLYRTDQWEAGEIYEDTYRIPLENISDTPFQPYFKIGWRDHQTDAYITPSTRDAEFLTDVVLRGGSIYADDACRTYPRQVGARFADMVRLESYRLSETVVQPGATITLDLQWEVINAPEKDYTVFVQLINPDVPFTLRGSGDDVPRQGRYPTSAWASESCFEDRYTLQVDSDAPPGNYHIFIGFYDRDNQRLSLSDGGDSLMLEPVIVVEGSSQ